MLRALQLKGGIVSCVLCWYEFFEDIFGGGSDDDCPLTDSAASTSDPHTSAGGLCGGMRILRCT